MGKIENAHLDIMHPNTIWMTIKEDIEIKIIDGTLKSAEKVPSISEIANYYNVSKSTAQKALENMNEDGTITKRKGVGYFVVPYTRAKLKEKHLKNAMELFSYSFAYAKRLGLDLDDYLKSIEIKIYEWE